MKTILITGASRGIGRAIAVALAAKDIRLILHGRDQTALATTQQEAEARGATTKIVVADFSRPEEVAALAESLGAQPVDVLINNAGIAIIKPIEEYTLDDWQTTLAVNLTAPFLLTQKLLPRMTPGSSIVNILSVAAKTGFAGWNAYCTSKFALEGFSQCLREEVRPRGIRVINIYPAATATEIWKEIPGDWSLPDMMSADEVARAVVHALAAPASVLVDSISIGNVAGPQ